MPIQAVGAVAGGVIGASAGGVATAGAVGAGSLATATNILSGGSSIVSSIASIFSKKADQAESAVREQFGGGGPNVSGYQNWENVQIVKQSVLTAMGGDTSAPEWLQFLLDAPTNQLDRTISAGQNAISKYKARTMAEQEKASEVSTISQGTSSVVPPPMSVDQSSAINALTNAIGDIQSQMKPKESTFNWTPFLIAGAVLVVFIFLKRK